MATSDLRGRPKWQYQLASIMVGISLVATGAILVATGPASGQADLELGALHVDDVNRTVDGDVSDVRVTADVDYQYDVPDAERRIVRLRVGRSNESLENVTFRQDSSPAPQDSGSVTLSGSLTDTQAFTAADFDPALAGTQEQQIVVAAELEVRRSGGDPVTQTVVETVGVTVHDGAVLEAEVGGSGNVTVVAG